MFDFLKQNYELVKEGLKKIYGNENSSFYLTTNQIDGILKYLKYECNGIVDIQEWIDDVIINGYGFNFDGSIKELEE